ncbi:hypothetical protein FAES_2887 [Fibrella aestuarina BUZ 2]|uniref:Lipocalin-like domain-containing protein n=1 Tax=Fibrella aestuarina BUZ 2 TaxID=1166018 RepID=I0K9U3_9BACT|nr:hypothetical protein [Fibrella aestuarina]CCH00896.1 hypothetical protein FAES_2887 [Fibrella aestuarina BUZ 2]
MKRTTLQLLLAPFVLLLACSKPDTVPPAVLFGTWEGQTGITSAGDCVWSGIASMPTLATWQVTANTVKATVNRRVDQINVSITMQGTIVGNKLTLTEQKHVVCNGVPRTYDSRYEGIIGGKTLTLVALDTICPVERCIFRHTLTLTQQ